MHTFLHRLGGVCAHRAVVVIAVWVLILLGAFLARQQYGGDFANDYKVNGSESSQGLSVLHRSFPQQGGHSGSIVFHSDSGKVSQNASAVSKSMKNVSGLNHVLSASDPLTTKTSSRISKDGSTVNAPVSFDVVPSTLDDSYLDQLDDAVAPAKSAGLEVEYGGGAGEIADDPDDLDSELIGLGLALVLLFAMFRSVVASVLPLVAAVFGVGTGLVVIGLIAAHQTLPTTAPTIATLLGLGVAIDYGLFLVARHREQLESGTPVRASIARAVSTAGTSIVVAGGTVVIAILGLYVAGVSFVGGLGLSAAVVVAVTITASLTLVPALLGLAKRMVLRRGHRDPDTYADGSAEVDHERSAFARWGRDVAGHPWPWAIAATVVLVILAVPLLSMRLGQLDAGTDPTSDSSRRAYDLISAEFGPGVNGPLLVVAELPKQSQGADQKQLSSLQSQLKQTDDVASVAPPTVNKAGTVATISVIPDGAPQDASTTTLVDTIRSDVLSKQDPPAYLVGQTAGYVDFTSKISQRLPWLIGAVVLLALMLLTVAFRSLTVGLKAAVLNLLSVGAAYGVIVAVFQWGWGSSLVGIDEKVPIPAFVPMLMFAIVFGLSMDYEVFLLSRVREAWLATGDARRSVAIGIGATARVITTAAAIMIAVFTSFALTDDASVKMLAIGMAVAVLIDSTIVRMILVPAVMALFGKNAWWLPRWLDRIIPDLDLEGGPAPEPAPVAVSETRPVGNRS